MLNTHKKWFRILSFIMSLAFIISSFSSVGRATSTRYEVSVIKTDIPKYSANKLSNDINILKDTENKTDSTEGESYETPLEMYNYVRTHIASELGIKYRREADDVKAAGKATASENAALLIGMLRDKGYDAKYVHGQAVLSEEQVKYMTGASSIDKAADVYKENGIKPTKLTSNGATIGLIVEHIWVRAYLPMTDYRGAKDNEGEYAWIDLDAYVKNSNLAQVETLDLLPYSLQYETRGLNGNGNPVVSDDIPEDLIASEEEPTTEEKKEEEDNPDESNGLTVLITSPENDDIVTAPTDIIGTVSCNTGKVEYSIGYRPYGKGDYTEFASGKESVDNGNLGQLDPTLLANGRYQIRITAKDDKGNSKKVTKTVNIEGALKVGNYHIGFTDITASMGGTTVSVNRIYDSMVKESGDFGYGWSMSMQGLKLYENADLSAGYQQVVSGSAFSTRYQMTETKNHDVIVTYGDGTSDRFVLTFNPAMSVLRPIEEVTLGYKCVTNQKVKLEVLGDTTGTYTSGMILFYELDSFSNPSYRLTTENGEKLYLNKNKGVYRIEDNAGHIVTVDDNGYHSTDGKSIELKRDKQNRVTEAIDPLGNKTTYKYDKNGDLVSVTDSADRTVSYTYDNKHNLISITDPMGVAVSRNEYDNEGRLVATIDADGNRMEFSHDVEGRQEVVSDRLGNKTVYVYDDKGNVLQTTDANGHTTKSTYDAYGNVLTYTDARGNVTKSEYDNNGNVTSVIDADGNHISVEYNSNNKAIKIATVDDKNILIDYDKAGNIISTQNVDGSIVKYDRDVDGNIKSISDEIGKVYSAEYDSSGNVISASDQAGNVTNYTYDESGNRLSESKTVKTDEGDVVRTIKYNYNDCGELISTEDADGNLTTVEKNKNGQTIATVDSEGRRTSYQYNTIGKVTEINYSDGTKEKFTFDAEGRTLSSVDRIGVKKEFSYDKVGNLIKETDSRGNITSFEYDENNNLTKAIYPTGYNKTYYYDALNRNVKTTDIDGNTTTFEYDERSLLTSFTDAKGNTTNYEYNDRGERIKTIYADGSYESSNTDSRGRCVSITSVSGKKTEYTYDSADRLIKVTQNSGVETNYTYDSQGNLISVKDGNGNVTKYKYDVNSRRIATILPDGSSMSYTYDSYGKIIEISDYNGVKTVYSYDEEDRPNEVITGDNAIEYSYDDYGRVKSVKSNDSKITYSYNKYGELEEKTYENGQKIRYSYDKFGRESSVESYNGNDNYTAVNFEYDSQGRLSKVIDGNKTVTEYTYDPNGNRADAKYSNGIYIEYKYDNCNRLIVEKVNDKSKKQIVEYSYEYKNGLKVKSSEKKSDCETISEYERDEEDRLTLDKITEIKNGNKAVTTYSYQYDKVGNRISSSVNGVNTKYKYNSNNQLFSEEISVNGDLNKTLYTYDKNGNLLSKDDGNVKSVYTYDVYNRMTEYKCGSIDYSYTYDAEGVRRSKTNNVAKNTTLYVTDTNCDYSTTLAETDTNGKLNRGYISAGEIISMNFSNQSIYYICDGHGDVRILTDENGIEKSTYRYNAYGEIIEKKDTFDNGYLYAGEYLDSETGLYYLRARYMDTSSGIFTSMDTYEGTTSDPNSLHKYLYANADPVSYTDPSGHSFAMVQTIICTGIMNVLNHSDAIITMGMINSTITGAMLTLMGCPDDVVLKGMVEGFVVGAFLGALSFFCTAALGMSTIQFALCNAGAMTSVNLFLAVYYAMKGDNLQSVLCFSMALISFAQFCYLYGLVANVTLSSGGNLSEKTNFAVNEEGTGEIGNGKQYSVMYEASTGNGSSRSAHRNAANKQFYEALKNNPDFKKAIDKFFGYDVMDYMKSGSGGYKNPSPEWVWHHPADRPGVIQLIPKNQHQASELQIFLHPGPNGEGGYGLYY